MGFANFQSAEMHGAATDPSLACHVCPSGGWQGCREETMQPQPSLLLNPACCTMPNNGHQYSPLSERYCCVNTQKHGSVLCHVACLQEAACTTLATRFKDRATTFLLWLPHLLHKRMACYDCCGWFGTLCCLTVVAVVAGCCWCCILVRWNLQC
jgi:hypothetical protein